MPVDPSIRDHKIWIGYLQPEGLVVSPAALIDAQVVLDRASVPLQQRFQTLVEEIPHADETIPAVTSLRRLLLDFLEWPEECLYGLSAERPIPESLKIPLRDFGETLEPTHAFQQPNPDNPDNPDNPWLLLIQNLPTGADFDEPVESKLAGWSASPTRRFERLLREAQVPIGLLANGTKFRLLYAPRGENAGSLTFPVQAMTEVAGRSILGAFHLLLSRYRLLAAPSEARLPALLKRSRDYQSRVSTALAKQVLDALYELLRGFQAADDNTHHALLKQVLADDPDQIYSGLLTVLMRLVFLLYAEDQGLMPDSDLYARNYSIHGLFERLRADAEQYPDTMESRRGAWAQLVALFRAVHRGCTHPLIKVPAREGHLFAPDRYPFLEGRSEELQLDEGPLKLPHVPDGTIYRVLEKLLVLEGERLSYRTLDVEQIGSVYETMMGFRLERAGGTSIAMKAAKAHGAPTPVNLDALLATRAIDRAKYVQERTDYKLTATMNNAVKGAESIDDLLAALERRIARNATPQPVSAGTMVLVPTDERRKTGSHYTPRSLTQPIVETTLKPILEQLISPASSPGEGRGEGAPTPDQILNLKVCDPAMGSGAFLVEACRQLAEALVAAWAAHGYKPYIPPDEDELLHARRLVAQRCLYGVDRNPMAVDLAKLSLWLATLAKDHPFTFLDHSLRAGDSLVGLTRRQIVGFSLDPPAQIGFVEAEVRKSMDRATTARRTILEAGDNMLPGMKQHKLQLADDALSLVRLAGDAVVAAFFMASRPRERAERREELFALLDAYIQHNDLTARQQLGAAVRALREGKDGQPPVTPFHWEIEFPEVFGRDPKGFDCIVGNPPFMGGTTISAQVGMVYFQFLTSQFPPAEHHCDLVAYFFRRAFTIQRLRGTFGLLATNTIAQGDTREGGLKAILAEDGQIYSARSRYRWPGIAAVLVSVVHVSKKLNVMPILLDGVSVSRISAYLLEGETDGSPARLRTNPYFSLGCKIYGQGFVFADGDPDCTPIAEAERILQSQTASAQRILPYIGGEEVITYPDHRSVRYVICLSDVETEEQLREWPELERIVRAKVKPERDALGLNPNNVPLRRKWWAFQAHRPELYAAVGEVHRVLVTPRVAEYMAFVFLSSRMIYSEQLVVIPVENDERFCVLQSRLHEVWTRLFASSLEDRLRYTPSDCYETFPFPADVDDCNSLGTMGKNYYAHRASLMRLSNEGLTKLYNRFHNPGENCADILRLRELHDSMDRAVLDAYGWTDIQPTCEFLLDYEEDDEESGEPSPQPSPSGRGSRRRRKPWRYRWPDEVRDEVLARLLKLNAERAAEERRTGAAAAAAEKAVRPRTPRKKKAPKNSGDPTLPGME